MSAPVIHRVGLALGAAAALALCGGLLSGLYAERGTARAANESAPATTPSVGRDPVLALRALDSHAHWGRYKPPEAGVAAQPSPTPRTVNAEGIARDYRLVGIERRNGALQVLLLPAAAPIDSAEVIRLGPGDTLAPGIRVSVIGHDSVGFATSAGTSTLHLYGSEP